MPLTPTGITYDPTNLTMAERKQMLQQLETMQAGLAQCIQLTRDAIMDDMDAANNIETLTAGGVQTGTITYRKGSAGKLKVKDTVKYAHWLDLTGHSDMVEELPQPNDAAKAHTYLEAMRDAAAFNPLTGEQVKEPGVLPDGVEEGRGLSGGLTVKWEKQAYDAIMRTMRPAQVLHLLESGQPVEDMEEF